VEQVDARDFDNSRRGDKTMKVINIYTCPDGRVRAYCRDDNNNVKIVSYPRILMEEKLGRPLEPYEDVHHIDGNKLNNSIDNLALINHGDHQKMHMEHDTKYHNKEMTCDVCGKTFIWTIKSQRNYYCDLNRGKNRIISCSRKCSSYYGRQEQLGRNPKAECGLNGEPFPNGNTVPNK